MAETENPKDELPSDADMRAAIGGSIAFFLKQKPDYAYIHGGKVLNPQIALFYILHLVGKSTERQEKVLSETSACIQRQEVIAKNLLKESKRVTWLTLGVFVLTAAVLGLTAVLVLR
jgi:hypothetical protein